MTRTSRLRIALFALFAAVAIASASFWRLSGDGKVAQAALPTSEDYVALDCGNGPNVDCTIVVGSVSTLDVKVIFGNPLGVSKQLAGFNFDVFNPDTTRLNPVVVPNLNTAVLSNVGWNCGSPPALANSGLYAAGTSDTFLSCIDNGGFGNTMAATSSNHIATVHYNVTAASSGDVQLTSFAVSVSDDNVVALVTCDATDTAPIPPVVVGAPCFDVAIHFVGAPTATPTSTPTNTPTATATPTITPTPSIPDTDGDGLNDNEEALLGTNPAVADTDADGLNDGLEVHTTLTDPLKADTDGDGLNDGVEVNTTSTNPHIADTDGDGLSDGNEVNVSLSNPNNVDTDGDGLHDGAEVLSFFTNPNDPDTDGDGLNDLQEVVIGTNPKNPDTDGDTLTDGQEVLTYSTSPFLQDTDGDTLTDAMEVNITGTNPRVADTDNDGLSDGYELLVSLTNPNNADTDGDGVTDGAEVNIYHSNPHVTDTDGDTMPDGFEVLNSFCLNVLVNDAAADPDLDAVGNVAELGQGTLPCNPDTDGDGFRDKTATSQALNNPNPAQDNCILIPNPTQLNSDGDFIDLPPVFFFDDLTQPKSDAIGDSCDPDADNDGIPNGVETGGPPCASATGPTDPTKLDTDGDTFTDQAECLLGTDPANAASKPPQAPGGDADHDGLPDFIEPFVGANPALPDTDGDGILDGVEVRFYGSSPALTDSDSDGCADGKEIASVNDDRKVNSSDMLIVAQHFANLGSPNYIKEVDLNKDLKVNSLDMSLVSKEFGPC